MREARAYAKSIYLIGGMPYLLFAAFGVYAYRATRKQHRELPNDGLSEELPE